MEYWTGKRVVVTGGAGFLGSFVIEKLKARGTHAIFAPRRRDYDLRDLCAVRRLLNDTRPDIVIHLAAKVGGIGANRVRPGEFFYDNLMMGVQLLDESRRYGLGKFVAVGTVCSYPKNPRVPFQEDDFWNGYPEETNAPYGLAKKMLLVQSQAYRKQYDFHAIYLIPVNLYGPRDNFDLDEGHVIPAIIRKCVGAVEHGEREIVCWGDGTPTREFLYVEDCAEAIVLAAEHYDGLEPVNIGAGFEISIRDLVGLIAELTEFKGRITWDTSKPNGQPRRCLDTRGARELFGFQAKTDLRAGLQRTIAWFLEHNAPRILASREHAWNE